MIKRGQRIGVLWQYGCGHALPSVCSCANRNRYTRLLQTVTESIALWHLLRLNRNHLPIFCFSRKIDFHHAKLALSPLVLTNKPVLDKFLDRFAAVLPHRRHVFFVTGIFPDSRRNSFSSLTICSSTLNRAQPSSDDFSILSV